MHGNSKADGCCTLRKGVVAAKLMDAVLDAIESIKLSIYLSKINNFALRGLSFYLTFLVFPKWIDDGKYNIIP